LKKIDLINDRHIISILDDVRKVFLEFFGEKIYQLILYGSYARNEQVKDSDIDIMILFDEPSKPLNEYRYLIAKIMADLSLKHDVLISITEEERKRFLDYLDILPFYRNIQNEGIEIYGRKTN
jgi:uncharacterized protein